MIFYTLAILYIVISGTATAHVLLNKGDVRSAIGWIGLIWFSPFIGTAIYYAFGINRVARRASKIFQDSNYIEKTLKNPVFQKSPLNQNIYQMAQVGDQMSGFPIVAGNKLTILRNGDEAYPEMLATIANAHRSIALAMYIFRLDKAGAEFVDALIAARDRGVEVRVLVDGIGSGYIFSPIVRRLENAGIPVRRFMHGWLPWQVSFINLRNHKKLTIVDGAIGFVGGINLGGENIWNMLRKREVNDTHFRMDGPIVGQLMANFADDWHFTSSEALSSKIWWPTIKPAGSVVARSIVSGPDEDLGKIETIFSFAISQAKHHIRIVTPYFLPDQRLKTIMNLAILRGVKIDLIIPAHTDFKLMDWAMRGNFSFMDIDKFNCRLSSSPFDHSKLMTVDGRWCAFGSPNWDVRSLRLNFEFLLECYDEHSVRAIDRLVDEKLRQSKKLTADQLEDRNLITHLRDACARLFLPYL